MIGFLDSNNLAYAIEHNLVGGYQFSQRNIQNANETRGGNAIELGSGSIMSITTASEVETK